MISKAWNFHQSEVSSPNFESMEGAYTTLRLEMHVKLVAFFLDRHLDRLMNSMRLLGHETLFEKAQLKELLIGFLNTHFVDRPNRLKVFLTRDILGVRMGPIPVYTDPFHGVPFLFERPLPEAKPIQRGFLAERLSHLNPIHEELLLVSKEGLIREGGTSNLIFVKEDQFFTPGDHALPGITLQVLVESLQEEEKPQRCQIPLESLGEFDEILVVGTGKEIQRLTDVNSYFRCKSEIGFQYLRSVYANAKTAYLKSKDLL